MELLILDTNLKEVAVFDTFESLIWTDRFRGFGEFEIYAKESEEIRKILKDDYYVWYGDSEHVMIIESSNTDSNVESGDKIIIGGRSLESILNRRIVWEQTVLTGNLQNGILKLLNENAISPTIPERAILNFVFETSDDVAITNLTIDSQLNRGSNLYDAINNICLSNNIGFKIILSNDNKFVFKLYAGKDRSYDQITNPYVIFSPKFENILNSNYKHSTVKLKNVTLVVGEETDDIGIQQKTTIVGSATSINRREVYTDATSISQTTETENLTDEVYIAQLNQKGTETLLKNLIENSIEGKMDTTRVFVYKKDFFMGDVVQLVGDYGVEGKARISEIIHSENPQGISTHPTFEIIKQKEV